MILLITIQSLHRPVKQLNVPPSNGDQHLELQQQHTKSFINSYSHLGEVILFLIKRVGI